MNDHAERGGTIWTTCSGPADQNSLGLERGFTSNENDFPKRLIKLPG